MKNLKSGALVLEDCNYEIRSSVFFELWSTGGGEFGVASVKV